MFFTFDLCLLLYVIRLAGWLKHCNLSLSQYRKHGFNHTCSNATSACLSAYTYVRLAATAAAAKFGPCKSAQ